MYKKNAAASFAVAAGFWFFMAEIFENERLSIFLCKFDSPVVSKRMRQQALQELQEFCFCLAEIFEKEGLFVFFISFTSVL